MHYIKDVFENKSTEHAHNKFVRYSKGSFVGPLVNIKAGPSGVKVSASFHFVDELLELAKEVLGNKEVHVKGTLIWNADLSEHFHNLGIMYSKVTKARGSFKYVLDNNIKFSDFVDTLGKYNLLLTIKDEDLTFVTKSSFPKPNKEFGPDFVKVTFPLSMKEKLLEEFAFDCENTIKDVKIVHHINVEDIKLPENFTDFEEARRAAIRSGTLVRSVEVKGKEPFEKSIDFSI